MATGSSGGNPRTRPGGWSVLLSYRLPRELSSQRIAVWRHLKLYEYHRRAALLGREPA